MRLSYVCVRVCFEVEREKLSSPFLPSRTWELNLFENVGSRRSDRGCTILLAIPILPVSKVRVYYSISIREGAIRKGGRDQKR